MHRSFGPLILLSALVVLGGAYVSFGLYETSGLPFSIHVVDAQTALIEPVPGIPMPSALHAGDRVDLSALPSATRIAISMTNGLSALPPERTYTFTIHRGGALIAAPIKTVRWDAATSLRSLQWVTRCFAVLLAAIALLAVWRGRHRAAAGMAIWAIAFLAAYTTAFIPSDGTAGLCLLLGEMILILLARVGFYLMAESVVGTALGPRARAWWRASFLLLLAFGAVAGLGGPLAFVTTGWATLMRPEYGVALTAPYLVPIALLWVSYRGAQVAQRLRLRWTLGSSVVLAAGIFLSNTPMLGFLASEIASRFMFAMAMLGFLYAVLRHRVVEVAVVLNRALVYTATTSFLLGMLALLESLVERMTLGHDAGLLLELAVPVGLGAALSAVHRRIEATVEQFFFRRQYREDAALRSFARECAFVTNPENLLDLTVDQMSLHTGAPWVAVYEHSANGYVRVRQGGSHDLPPRVNDDDLTFVKLRTHDTEVDLNNTSSALGQEGYVFPLRVRGSLLGALVVGPRSGEHYMADERELFGHVAHEVGAALFALRAQAAEARAQASEELLTVARAREAALLEVLSAYGANARS